jgi:hypothetical protein
VRSFTLATRHLVIGCAAIGLLLGGCAREDLSQYLSSGMCDEQGRCADGYECQASTWQCVKAGQSLDAGATARTPDAPSDLTPDVASVEPDVGVAQPDALTPDVASVEPDVGGAQPDALSPDGGAASQPDACPPGGCLCNGLAVCTQGMTCCLGYGCADLNTQSDHCGACGKSCPKLHKCQDGACRCQNDKACEAGTAGVCTSQGRCQCGGVVCAPGLRCVAAGVCG